jgi:thymidylate synthase (FAD)
MGSDVSIVRSARVSYDAEWRAGEDEKSDKRLIKYLWNHHHTTPFEAATLTFEVMAPIFVFRQWHRHRTQSYNELSGRYRELPAVFYVPEVDVVGIQSSSNKQGRDTTVNNEELLRTRAEEIAVYKSDCEAAFRQYQARLESGWPKELARLGLPVSTYSHMFTTMNLLNCLKFLTLRADSHAQYEVRVYANAMIELLQPHFPVTMQVFLDSLKGLAL